MKIARVVIDNSVRQIDRFFDYAVPDNLSKTVQVGKRAEVPFGAADKINTGYIVKIFEEDADPKKYKNIIKLLDEYPMIDRTHLLEAYWIKKHYFCSFSEGIRLFLPSGSTRDIKEWVILNKNVTMRDDTEKKIAEILKNDGGTSSYDKIKEVMGKSARARLKQMQQRGLITFSYTNTSKTKDKTVTVVSLAQDDIPDIPDKLKAQKRAVRILKECKMLSITDLCLFACVTRATVTALEKKGIIVKNKIEVLRKVGNTFRQEDSSVTLTDEQKKATDTIENAMNKGFKPFLIKGVTGSGKTEVYMQLTEKIIKNDGSVIILVPEIALTHQMVGRFLSRFGDKVAVLHSGLNIGQRFDEWKRIRRGDARVVVGARSAVFAPCKNLKMIVVDEEHDDSYKSESGVRYHARDVALCRAKTENAIAVLASATPSVESYYRAKTGIYELIEMKHRYNNAPLPKTYIADMREELKSGNRSPISRMLKNEIRKNTENGEQSILFLNKRGHSSFVSCRECGYVPKCPNCSVTLTYHSISDNLICHLCGYRINLLKSCPECKGKSIKAFGTGTQKIEETLQKDYETAKVIRMDLDSTSGRESHEKILNRFREENIDILLGTQMVSKGLDFSNVTLVGVLAADQSLNMGDYKAAERTFDLITQVCGRAGRGEKQGRAVIQTYMPEDSVIIHAANQDYDAFYDDEIIIRKALKYPPFCDIINIIFTGKNESEVMKAATEMCLKVQKMPDCSMKIYKATPCGINKINNVYRWHFWIKCHLNDKIRSDICDLIASEKHIAVTVDINPSSI